MGDFVHDHQLNGQQILAMISEGIPGRGISEQAVQCFAAQPGYLRFGIVGGGEAGQLRVQRFAHALGGPAVT